MKDADSIPSRISSPYGQISTLSDRPVIAIHVTDGPGQGQSASFDQAKVTIGKHPSCDFSIADDRIPEFQGEFLRTSDGFLYRDVLDASPAVFKNQARRDFPQGAMSLTSESDMTLGGSAIHIEISRIYHSLDQSGVFKIKLTPKETGEFLLASGGESVLDELHGRDPRLAPILDLASALNRLNRKEEMLEYTAEKVFGMFASANLYSVSLLEDDHLRPIKIRFRDESEPHPEEVVMSRSVLKQVVDSEEAVLFVRGMDQLFPSQSLLMSGITSCMCAPLIGRQGLLGVMQVDTRRDGSKFTRHDLDLFQAIAMQIAFALERATLVDEIYRMFDCFVAASVHAIEARDPTTAGHSERVAEYSLRLADAVNATKAGPLAQVYFSPLALTELRYAALLHDFGKVGVREAVLMKAARVDDARMALITQRFKTLAARKQQDLFEEVLLESASDLSLEERMARAKKTGQAFAQKLDKCCRFLEASRWKWTLSEAEIESIQQLGQKKLTTRNGEELLYLEPEELENLTIPMGTLNDNEWEDMRSHVSQSRAYLEQIPWSEDLAKIPCLAGGHHERLDGSGYPDGLTAEQLSPGVRILMIADIFDAVTAWDRPYTMPFGIKDAARILRQKADEGRIDVDLVKLFEEKVLPEVIDTVPDRPGPPRNA